MLTEGEIIAEIDRSLCELRDHDEEGFQRIVAWFLAKFVPSSTNEQERGASPPISAEKETTPETMPIKAGFKAQSLANRITHATAKNPQLLARAIRTSPAYSVLKKNFFETESRSRWRKVAGILCMAKLPMTSGQIARTLDELGYPLGVSGVSSTLSKNDSFVAGRRGKGGVKRYKLSNAKLEELEQELGSTPKSGG